MQFLEMFHIFLGSTKKRVYEEKINAIDPDKHLENFKSFKDIIDKVLDGSSMIYVSIDPFIRGPEYPCEIITTKFLRFGKLFV